MRQIWIPKIGPPEVLVIQEAPDPSARANEVRIRVRACGVNFADIMARVGLYPDAPKLPTVVGYEVSGTIDQVGDGVRQFKKGDSVFALTRFGGYSDTLVVPANQVFPVPSSLSMEEGAAIPVNYLTAWLMLVTQANVQAGDKVLIHAVAGGVGQAAVQICRLHAAEIFGTASARKHPHLRELGVAHCIDYNKQDFEQEVKTITVGQGVAIVLDSVGGRSFRKSYNCLAPLGKLCLFGVSSLSTGLKRSVIGALKGLLLMPSFKPIALMNQNRAVLGFNLGHLWSETQRIDRAIQEMAPLFEKGALKPVIDRTFPFDEAAAAHRYIQDRKNFGKVLLIP